MSCVQLEWLGIENKVQVIDGYLLMDGALSWGRLVIHYTFLLMVLINILLLTPLWSSIMKLSRQTHNSKEKTYWDNFKRQNIWKEWLSNYFSHKDPRKKTSFVFVIYSKNGDVNIGLGPISTSWLSLISPMFSKLLSRTCYHQNNILCTEYTFLFTCSHQKVLIYGKIIKNHLNFCIFLNEMFLEKSCIEVMHLSRCQELHFELVSVSWSSCCYTDQLFLTVSFHAKLLVV